MNGRLKLPWGVSTHCAPRNIWLLHNACWTILLINTVIWTKKWIDLYVYVQENLAFYLGRSLARSIFKLLRFQLVKRKKKKEPWACLQKFHFGDPKAKIEIGGKERIIRFSSFPTLCTYELCYLGYFNFSSLAATCRRVFTIFFHSLWWRKS